MTLAPPADTARDQRDLLRTIAEGTAGTVGAAFLRSLARCLAAAFAADVAYLAELGDADPATRARILACWPGGELLPEGYEYALADTPCEPIDRVDVISHPSGTVERFPDDGFIVRNGLDGYLGVPMYGAAGTTMGYVCVLSRGQVDAGPEEFAVLRIFAARAAAELERRRHEAALRAREAEVTASRTRLVHAADEERRRIGRDLHDGAQQRLVVLTQSLDIALREARRRPEQATTLIEQAREQARIAAGELREIARGLHPAGLSACGLGPALRSLGLNAPVALRLGALPEQRLPDPVEVTVYYLVAEALSNAVKHARRDRAARRRRPPRPGGPRRGRRRRHRRRAGRARRRPARPARPARGARRAARGRERPGGGHAAARLDPGRPVARRARAVHRVRLRGRRRRGRARGRADPRRQQDRLGVARARVGPGGRAAADRPAAPDHRPPRRAPRDRRGHARLRAPVRPDRRGHGERRERRAPGRSTSGSPATARSTTAAATRWRCCSASRAGASRKASRWSSRPSAAPNRLAATGAASA